MTFPSSALDRYELHQFSLLVFLCGGFRGHGGTPSYHPNFRLAFSIVNHPDIGVPPQNYGNPHLFFPSSCWSPGLRILLDPVLRGILLLHYLLSVCRWPKALVNWGFPSMGIPQTGWLKTEIPLKWIICGYPHVWNPPTQWVRLSETVKRGESESAQQPSCTRRWHLWDGSDHCSSAKIRQEPLGNLRMFDAENGLLFSRFPRHVHECMIQSVVTIR